MQGNYIHIAKSGWSKTRTMLRIYQGPYEATPEEDPALSLIIDFIMFSRRRRLVVYNVFGKFVPIAAESVPRDLPECLMLYIINHLPTSS